MFCSPTFSDSASSATRVKLSLPPPPPLYHKQILSVNVKGYANCTKFSLPYLRKAGGGSIVNMASVSSHIAQPAFVPYNTSKGAIMQMTRCVLRAFSKHCTL